MQSGYPSILSSCYSFHKAEIFSNQAVHPFANTAAATCDLLQDLINTTDQVSRSLELYNSSTQWSWSNYKLISLLRQHTSIEHAVHSSAKNVQHLIDVLSTRPDVMYGESIPLLSSSIPQWCVEQLVAWGKSVGMESFCDEGQEGRYTVMLGGKVLVIDVDLVLERRDPLKPVLRVANVKTSNALSQSSGSTLTTSAPLDAFLAEHIASYCAEMQLEEEARNPLRAASLRKNIVEYLQYLVLLDRLASRKDDGGIRWFTDLDEFFPTMIAVAETEAENVASSLSMTKAPLDIFLLRSHSLPLPYLKSPSVSFLTYLSPAAYLTLLDKPQAENPGDATYPHIDLGISTIKSHLDSLGSDAVVATLFVDKISEANLYPASMSMPNAPARPSFPLSPLSADLDHSFPQIDNFNLHPDSQGPSNLKQEAYAWVLDFTDHGKRPGVVMSQSRMKVIELVVNPLGEGDGLHGVTDILSFSNGSWVDLLINPGRNIVSPERYTALYRSPNSLHPPLQLRLTAPEEPGFILERIPVHSIKEIWGILEVVREQSWLNGILMGCHWTTEGLKSEEEDIPDDTGATATEEELQAILDGTYTPRKIPVNVFLPSGSPTDNLFGTTDLGFSPASAPKIVMTSPERAPISGLVEITVTHDETKPRGVSVEVHGAMGSDLKPADLEEICRRGGTLGLSGRVWARGHHHMNA
ncbi:hypothetical protein CPC08DRAFT_708496 [Agrocybe pediades]|nr:hypothetical protein CPC08DRAFT_708496 [Agrocybe pediades]